MFFEHSLFYKDNLNLHGSSQKRVAARAVIIEDGNIVLAYLKSTNEFKFPGGGVREGEDLKTALIREVKEEIGATVERIGEEIAVMNEYDKTENDLVDFFHMESHYFEVRIKREIGEQNLDDYEKEYGYRLMRVSIGEAYRVNNATMGSSPKTTKWIRRETYVLERLKEEFPDREPFAEERMPIQKHAFLENRMEVDKPLSPYS